MKNHRGLFPLYNTGIATFFVIALVIVVILVNIGFAITDTDKQVVEKEGPKVKELIARAIRRSLAA